MSKATTIGALMAVAMLASTGCRLEEAYQKWAQQATDSVDTVQGESALLVASTEGVDPTMDGAEAAAAAAEHAGRFYQPAGCLTATVSGRTVEYVLDDCTGPYGLLHVTGTVTVDYTPQADGLGYTTTARGLHINGATVDVDGQGVYRRVGTRHEIRGAVSGRGTGPRGHSFTRSGMRTFTWDPGTACMTLDGEWTTDVEGKSWDTIVTDFEKCGRSCPAEGGAISWIGPRNSLAVRYDGTDVAEWSTAAGREGTVSLFCE